MKRMASRAGRAVLRRRRAKGRPNCPPSYLQKNALRGIFVLLFKAIF